MQVRNSCRGPPHTCTLQGLLTMAGGLAVVAESHPSCRDGGISAYSHKPASCLQPGCSRRDDWHWP